MKKYEIELTYFIDHWLESYVAMLTGLELNEILVHSSKIKRWGGQRWIYLFQSLGYKCNTRFIKFDKKTEYPCLMRTKKLHDNKYWYPFVYYDGKVYDPGNPIMTWAEWKHLYPNYKVTSMLQVWI